jgi:glutamine synthetase
VSTTDLAALAAELKAKGVRALTVTWCDANGIQRSRTAPIDKLASAVERGMGCSFLFAVFDSHDHIHWGVDGVNTPTGDFRAKAVAERIVQLAGQPAFAWAPGQLWLQEGPRWEHCYRAALERIVERTTGLGYELKAGLELEWFIGQDSDEPEAAHNGPVYSPNAMLDVTEFISELLADLDANGL